MDTLVLSGPADRVAQARQMLAQQGYRVEDSTETINGHVPGGLGKVAKRDYSHGFDVDDGEGWITAHGDVNRSDEDLGAWAVVEPLGFTLRMHWTAGTQGEWNNPKQQPDPMAKYAELEARIRAAGIILPEV